MTERSALRPLKDHQNMNISNSGEVRALLRQIKQVSFTQYHSEILVPLLRMTIEKGRKIQLTRSTNCEDYLPIAVLSRLFIVLLLIDHNNCLGIGSRLVRDCESTSFYHHSILTVCGNSQSCIWSSLRTRDTVTGIL